MAARSWKATRLLLAILVALVAFSYQVKRKTFIRIEEVSALESSVKETLEYVTDEYNKKSEDLYNFRILRILKIMKQVSVWLPCLSSPEGPCALVKFQDFVLMRSHCAD